VHEARFGETLHTRAELGTRSWSHAEGRPFARLAASFERDGSSLGLDVERTDHIDRSDSLAALREGLRQLGVGAQFSTALARSWSLWSDARWLRVTDGNQRWSGELALTWTPWSERDLGVDFAAGALGYGSTALAYYAPESDLAVTAGLHGGAALPGRLRLRAGARAGVGRVHELDLIETGAIGSANAELAWENGGWSATLRAEYGFSARADGWHWGAALLRVERRF
jgi:hypothetical protein